MKCENCNCDEKEADEFGVKIQEHKFDDGEKVNLCDTCYSDLKFEAEHS